MSDEQQFIGSCDQLQSQLEQVIFDLEELLEGSLALGSGRDMPWIEILDRPNMRFILPVHFELKQINLAQKNGVAN